MRRAIGRGGAVAALLALWLAAGAEAVGLFFHAGHGFQVAAVGFRVARTLP